MSDIPETILKALKAEAKYVHNGYYRGTMSRDEILKYIYNKVARDETLWVDGAQFVKMSFKPFAIVFRLPDSKVVRMCVRYKRGGSKKQRNVNYDGKHEFYIEIY